MIETESELTIECNVKLMKRRYLMGYLLLHVVYTRRMSHEIDAALYQKT